jgi:hypothetical protein
MGHTPSLIWKRRRNLLLRLYHSVYYCIVQKRYIPVCISSAFGSLTAEHWAEHLGCTSTTTARMRSVTKLQPKVPEKHPEDPENALGFLPRLVRTYRTLFAHFPSILSFCISTVVQCILHAHSPRNPPSDDTRHYRKCQNGR